MKKLLRVLSLILVLVMALSLLACSETTETTKATQPTSAGPQVKKPNNGTKYVIGFSVSGLNHPLFAFQKTLFEAKCKELGVDYVITDGELKTDKQLNDIDTLISKKVDALLIMPNDGKGLIPGAEKATAAGIPVFVVTRAIPSDKDYITFVGSDDYMIGRMAGDYIAIALKGKGNVVEVTGTPGVSTAIDRSKGFNDVIKGYPNIKVVAQQTAKYQRNEAMTVMEAIIKANPVIDAVWGTNDEQSGGIISALQANNRKGVIVVGCNLQKDGYDRLISGEQAADITFPPEAVTKALEFSLDYLNGKAVPKSFMVPIDLVTKENALAFKGSVY